MSPHRAKRKTKRWEYDSMMNELAAKEPTRKKRKMSMAEREERREKKVDVAHEKKILNEIFKDTDKHACQPAIARALKRWFADNAAEITEDMRNSFLDACHEIDEGKTNIKSQSNHRLWEKAIASSELDFDWAAWIVLRTIYYDPVAKSQKPEDVKFKATLLTNEAAKKTRERYIDTDIFTDKLPADIEAPRPLGWPKLRKKEPKDKDAVGKKSTVRKPARSTKRKAQSESSDDEDEFIKLQSPNSPEVFRQAANNESISNTELAAGLSDHLKDRAENGYQPVPTEDDDKRPTKGEVREWRQNLIDAVDAGIQFHVDEAKKQWEEEWKQEKRILLERIQALEALVERYTAAFGR